ncbi:MAG: single-stranded-DNA-specific exonuclease RecJ [Parcubacteria group bacterium]|jgi:single-stranded-DNA-specific exonuclease
MQKKWTVLEKVDVVKSGLEEKFHPVVLQILANRGLLEKEQIKKFFLFDYDMDVLDPFLFRDMEKAVARIMQAKEEKEKIAIFGDYDADGVTATAVVFEALTKLGYPQIIYYIPDRQTEGYGMNEAAIRYLASEGVKLIITVDCGVTNVVEVELVKTLGMDIIITDHHHAPSVLPQAWAIINPQVADCGYPEKRLAGVGVAFKLMHGVYLRQAPEKIEQLKWLLDLVVIGTVADCVPLVGENRTLTRYGLVVLSKTRRTGLLEMFKVGRITIDENNIPDTQKIAFQIAPRINAAGRMDHASSSLKLLIETDVVQARDLALEVESKNKSRQKVTTEVTREVRALAENSFKARKLIFASSEHWQVGILGLIAGRIADEFNKPTAVFQKQATEFVGSFRSIDQFNIVQALEKCADLLIRFGGHSQAAGAQVKAENMEPFYERLAGIIEADLAGKDLAPAIEIDCELAAAEVSWELLENISKLQPFGEGNTEPTFLLRNLVVENIKILGNGSKHLKLSLRERQGAQVFNAIGFGLGENPLNIVEGDSIDIAFNLKEDEWNGHGAVQLFLVDIKISVS